MRDGDQPRRRQVGKERCRPAKGSQIGAIAAAMTPSTVAGGTAGTASRFAGTDSRLTREKRTAM